MSVNALSTPTIGIRHTSGIEPPLPVDHGDDPVRFRQPGVEDATEVTIELSSAGDEFSSRATFQTSTELVESLRRVSDANQIGKREKDELWKLQSRLSAAENRLLNLVLQELRIETRHMRVYRSGGHWSLDGNDWYDIPSGGAIAGVNIRPLFKLDRDWVNHLQTILDLKEEPLLATEHLQEAQRGQGRFAWIQATVAAELAIKEVLVRLEPRIKAILLEIPSPPLRKLYGSVLDEYSGVKSPYVSELHKGSEKRNLLVHRPEEVFLDPQEVVDYVNTVERAIRHLLRVCRDKKIRQGEVKLHRSSLEE